MYLIRKLAIKYNLTRTSLLHYDAIGLLSPSARTEAGYRLYSDEDEKRLQKILLYRSMGISLGNIKNLLGNDDSRLANALLIRLDELNQEIGELRQRQRNIIHLFKEVKNLEQFINHVSQDEIAPFLLKDIKLLEWHEHFEAISPNLHKEFLEILDLIPTSVKEAIQASLNSIPQEERNRLNKIIQIK